MSSKTYKREMAAALMGAYWGLVGFTAWQGRNDMEILMQLVNINVLPVFAFTALAFGLDWKSKQT